MEPIDSKYDEKEPTIAENETTEATVIENTFPDDHFTVDRTCIPTVSQDEQEKELTDLGIEVYQQEVLEKEILQQVDKALEIQKQKKAEELALQNEKKVQKQKKQETTPKKDKSNNEKKENEEKMETADVQNTFNITRPKETERERKIRMGEMTPFGSVVMLKTVRVNNLENNKKFEREQEERMKVKMSLKRKLSEKSESGETKIRKKQSGKPVLREKIFFPKKKKRKETLGTYISNKACDLVKSPGKLESEKTAMEESSGSEYLPEESDSEDVDFELEPVAKSIDKKSKKKRKIHTNEDPCYDSEEDYLSDEKCASIRKKGKKELDDGNETDYLERIEDWEKSSLCEEYETEFRNLGDGFKMPLVIWNRLYNYQKVGVQWLWELNIQRCGGILGDEMGLGKTIQIISFLTGLSVSNLISKYGSYRGLGPVLIVCPTTVMHQWVREFHIWWPRFRVALLHESGTHKGKKQSLVRDIVKSNGILITSYITCTQQSENLLRYNWHYIILDEGHKIRNPESQIATTVKMFGTPHRLILSGSPMQNNLKELWSLFDFIFPGKLGTLPVFMAEFSVPITQGGYTNASKVQVATAFKCATVLRDTISPYLLRRVKEDVKSHINLPPKNEQVLFCRLTEEQKELYVNYLNSSRVDDILSGKFKIFVGLIEMRKICNHPHLFTRGPKLFKWENPDSVPEEERFGYWKKAGKMIVVETLLKIWKKQGHRVLIFTQSRQMLRILEAFLRTKNYEYLKMDGTTSIGSRQPLINKFNEDKRYYIFLSTTHVGGLGVNLTGANRVLIYDPDWNPATDVQARERAWRIGQENQVTIYRLVTSGTIEEKIYHRQIFKQFLTNKVLKDPSQRRFFKSNDLYELFTYKDQVNETSEIFAGTNFEVNLKSLTHRQKVKKIKDKMRIIKKSVKEAVNTRATLSKEKIEKMRLMAQSLSKKIGLEAKKKDNKSSEASVNSENAVGEKVDHQEDLTTENTKAEQMDTKAEQMDTKAEQTDAKAEQTDTKAKQTDAKAEQTDTKAEKTDPKAGQIIKKKKKKHKKSKRDAIFEGEVVPHLQKLMKYRDLVKELTDNDGNDDYILKKLLSKTGVESALQHDQIMEEGSADYALVEGEAEKVAKEAVKALKESRKFYVRSSEGSQANKVISKPRFGKKTFGPKAGLTSNKGDVEKNEPMTSSELLQRIRQRNGLIPTISGTPDSPFNEHSELLVDIRNFISFGGDTESKATTQEIIDKFRDRLPTSQTPLFKALLNEICKFHRNSNGEGVWELRPEFRW